jgi:hypothetical protein
MHRSDLARIQNAMEFLTAGLNNFACNYRITLELGLADGRDPRPIPEVVADCVEKIVVHETWRSTPGELLEMIKNGLDESQSEHSGCNREFAQSESFRVVKDALLADLTKLLAEATHITRFSWDENTYLMPLMWGGGYVIEIGADAIVIIGTLSD